MSAPYFKVMPIAVRPTGTGGFHLTCDDGEYAGQGPTADGVFAEVLACPDAARIAEEIALRWHSHPLLVADCERLRRELDDAKGIVR